MASVRTAAERPQDWDPIRDMPDNLRWRWDKCPKGHQVLYGTEDPAPVENPVYCNDCHGWFKPDPEATPAYGSIPEGYYDPRNSYRDTRCTVDGRASA